MLERIGRALVAEQRAPDARTALNTARLIATEIGDEGLSAALKQLESAVEPQPKSTQVI
jgi:hypothetical protein